MTLARLLTERATVVRFTAGEDPRGDRDRGEWADVATWPALFHQLDAVETLGGRDTSVADWLVLLPAEADVKPRDRIRDGHGQAFEVDGLPGRPSRPDKGVHHLEVKLRAVID